MSTIINADFCAAVTLITFGVLLGRVSLSQLFLIGIFETLFWSFNEALVLTKLKASDIGGSMVIHMFGAYFGLACSFFIKAKESANHPKNESRYTSNLVAFVGTIFLFMYWPSFNSALSSGDAQQRAILNTYISIASSVVSSCLTSHFIFNKLDIEIVLNSTLAGGVAIGTACDLITLPGIAMLVGIFTGVISAIGFAYITPFLKKKFTLVDVCGVNNLHGIPAWIACLVSVFVALGLDKDRLNTSANRSYFSIEDVDDLAGI